MGRNSKRGEVEAHHCKNGQTLKDLLMDWYLGQKYSLSEIADKLCVTENKDEGIAEMFVSKSTVMNWLELFDIPLRDSVPSMVIESVEKSIKDDSKKEVSKGGQFFDPADEGFRCTSQCPYFDICKYKEYVEGDLCPISNKKKKTFIRPIRSLIADRYKDDPMLLAHYSNIADLTAATWEVLQRKLSYIQSEDVTQILNRPDPITGELKQVKVPNLLNGEIQKDQGMVIKLLELLRLTPKTSDDKESDENFLSNMVNLVEKAKSDRESKQVAIDEEDAKKQSRSEIKTHDDFVVAMEELEKRHGGAATEEEVSGAKSIEDMMKNSGA